MSQKVKAEYVDLENYMHQAKAKDVWINHCFLSTEMYYQPEVSMVVVWSIMRQSKHELCYQRSCIFRGNLP